MFEQYYLLSECIHDYNIHNIVWLNDEHKTMVIITIDNRAVVFSAPFSQIILQQDCFRYYKSQIKEKRKNLGIFSQEEVQTCLLEIQEKFGVEQTSIGAFQIPIPDSETKKIEQTIQSLWDDKIEDEVKRRFSNRYRSEPGTFQVGQKEIFDKESPSIRKQILESDEFDFNKFYADNFEQAINHLALPIESVRAINTETGISISIANLMAYKTLVEPVISTDSCFWLLSCSLPIICQSQAHQDNINNRQNAQSENLLESFTICETEGGGHCFYRSISEHLEYDHIELRQRCADFFENNKQMYCKYLPQEFLHQPDVYLTQMRRSMWATGLEIILCADLLQRPIVILPANTNLPVCVYQPEFKLNQPIFIHFDGTIIAAFSK